MRWIHRKPQLHTNRRTNQIYDPIYYQEKFKKKLCWYSEPLTELACNRCKNTSTSYWQQKSLWHTSPVWVRDCVKLSMVTCIYWMVSFSNIVDGFDERKFHFFAGLNVVKLVNGVSGDLGTCATSNFVTDTLLMTAFNAPWCPENIPLPEYPSNGILPPAANRFTLCANDHICWTWTATRTHEKNNQTE